MGKRWQVADGEAGAAEAIARELGLPRPMGRLLAGRGLVTRDQIERFLRPRLNDLSDPFLLPDMERAVVRLWDAVDAGESIVVFGDYDVDGVSSTALLVSFFSELGALATPFLPNRLTDGYGFSRRVLARCLEQYRPDVIVTVDCGTGAEDAVSLAREEGIDVIITDHHEAPGVPASACAVVNPKLGGAASVRMLAGVGVAFKLCHAMVKHARRQGRPGAAAMDIRPYMDFVALGTIADIVPLVEENRILARYGLSRLDAPRSLGLRTLMEVSGIRDAVQAHHIGFQLGPRLNAAGRMGDADAALELLLTDDAPRADDLARRLDAANRERQHIENRIVREARDEIDAWFDPSRDFGLVIAREGWHPGVIGIVASRLCQYYFRPVVVIGMDGQGQGRGSCRSVEGFDLVEQLGRCRDHLVQFGGHGMAAGVEIEGTAVPAFRERFNAVAAEALQQQVPVATQRVDAWVDLAEANQDLFDAGQLLRPFGHSNPTPVWAARALTIVQHRVVGNGHLQMTLADNKTSTDAIGFGLGERDVPNAPVDVAFHLKSSSYQGRESLRLDVQDFRVSGPNPPGNPAGQGP
jgi:single-stranded-DNA-specific exonuclease